RDLVGQVVLAAHRAEQIALVREGERGGQVHAGVGRRWNGQAFRDIDAGLVAAQPVILPADVRRQPGPVAAPIQAQPQRAQFALFVIDRRAAIAANGIQAYAGAVVRTEAAAEVDCGVTLVPAFPAERHLRQRLVRCTFRHDVDGPADRAVAGRRAVQEGAGAAKYVQPFDELAGEVLPRQQAVEAVVRDVVREQRKAADLVDLLVIAKAAGNPYRRIVLQDVGDAGCLLVLDQHAGV